MRQADNQGLGVMSLAWTSRFCRTQAESPLLLLLTPVPGQESFWPGDGNDLSQSIFDGQAVLHQNTPVGFGERHAGAEFAAEDFVFLPQEVVFQGQIAAE